MTESQWIKQYPVDYRKVCGTMHITKLEYRVIMKSLKEHCLFGLTAKLKERERDGDIWENNDRYYENLERLTGKVIKH